VTRLWHQTGAVGFCAWDRRLAVQAPLALASAVEPVVPTPTEDRLQELLNNGGVVTAPSGTVVLTRTLRLDKPGTTLRGSGPTNTRFVWAGPRDQPAIECRSGSWWFHLEGFSVEYPAGRLQGSHKLPGYDKGPFDDRAESIGLAFGVSDNVPGTCTGSGRVIRVGIAGFDCGVRVGKDSNGGTCASEITFESLHVAHARHAVLIDGWNALNFRFRMLALHYCWDGIYIPRGAAVSIESGSATLVGFYRSAEDYGAVMNIACGGVFACEKFRSEGGPSGCTVRNQVAMAGTMLTVEGCESSGDTFEGYPGGIKDIDRYAVTAAGNANVGVSRCRFLDAGLVRWRTFLDVSAGFADLRGNHYLKDHPACHRIGERLSNVTVNEAGNRPVERHGVPVK
jgi:hypothetical protein